MQQPAQRIEQPWSQRAYRVPGPSAAVAAREVYDHAEGMLALWGGDRSLLVGEPDPFFIAHGLKEAFGDRLYALLARHRHEDDPLRACLAAIEMLEAGVAEAARNFTALVIGNDTYENVAQLQKARNDARAMAAMFRAVDECPLPVIGKVRGAALGGGGGGEVVVSIRVFGTVNALRGGRGQDTRVLTYS